MNYQSPYNLIDGPNRAMKRPQLLCVYSRPLKHNFYLHLKVWNFLTNTKYKVIINFTSNPLRIHNLKKALKLTMMKGFIVNNSFNQL